MNKDDVKDHFEKGWETAKAVLDSRVATIAMMAGATIAWGMTMVWGFRKLFGKKTGEDEA